MSVITELSKEPICTRGYLWETVCTYSQVETFGLIFKCVPRTYGTPHTGFSIAAPEPKQTKTTNGARAKQNIHDDREREREREMENKHRKENPERDRSSMTRRVAQKL
jgi:hypothetical protein